MSNQFFSELKKSVLSENSLSIKKILLKRKLTKLLKSNERLEKIKEIYWHWTTENQFNIHFMFKHFLSDLQKVFPVEFIEENYLDSFSQGRILYSELKTIESTVNCSYGYGLVDPRHNIVYFSINPNAPKNYDKYFKAFFICLLLQDAFYLFEKNKKENSINKKTSIRFCLTNENIINPDVEHIYSYFKCAMILLMPFLKNTIVKRNIKKIDQLVAAYGLPERLVVQQLKNTGWISKSPPKSISNYETKTQSQPVQRKTSSSSDDDSVLSDLTQGVFVATGAALAVSVIDEVLDW